eukprot:CAMPEP_0179194932 /NCGR_PEP_ID=MMETSP0796-20121207/96893_1 /TAXON_ID=73915 /ORGANISM="Pyrodinium bahamense, Strain pbaha01" /LENGTH=138 /DNA_ID=CAMNT_0020899275 /DNA_START=72 /DNA_END=489 /DNA_ORIENTATION=+
MFGSVAWRIRQSACSATDSAHRACRAVPAPRRRGRRRWARARGRAPSPSPRRTGSPAAPLAAARLGGGHEAARRPGAAAAVEEVDVRDPTPPRLGRPIQEGLAYEDGACVQQEPAAIPAAREHLGQTIAEGAMRQRAC